MSQTKNNKLARYLTAFAGNEIILFLGSFISFPILTRILTKEDYGLMAILTITVAILSNISGVGLKDALLRYYSIYDSREKVSFLSTIFIFTVLNSFCCMILLWCISFVLLLIMSSFEVYNLYLIMLSSLLLLTRTIISNITAIFRVEEQVRKIIFVDFITRYGGLIASIILVFIYRNLYGYFGGLVIAEGFLAASLLWLIRKKLSVHAVNFRMLIQAVKYGLPLSVSNLSSFFLATGDRYVVSYFLGAGAVATYTVAYNLCNYVFELIKNIFMYTFMPLIMNHWNRDEVEESTRLLSIYFRLYVMVTLPAVFGLSAVGQGALTFLAGEKYADAYFLIPVLASGIAVNGLSHVTFSGLYYQSRSKEILGITLGCAILNLVLNLVLLPLVGLIGAAWATGVSYLLMVVTGSWFTHSLLRIDYSFVAIGKYLLISFLMYLLIVHVGVQGNIGLLIKVLLGAVSYLVMLMAIDFKYIKMAYGSL